MKKADSTEGRSASELIDRKIAELDDWRAEVLRRMRKLIKEADPEVVEEWKWMGTPVWSRVGRNDRLRPGWGPRTLGAGRL